MMIFGSLGLLNNVKAEQSYMRSFLNFLLEQERTKITQADVDAIISDITGSRQSGQAAPTSPDNGIRIMGMRAQNPQDEKRIEDLAKARPRSKKESPITSGIKSFANRAAKLGGEFADLMPDLEREEGYREFAYPDPLNPKTGPITVGIGSTRTREAEGVLRDRGINPSRVFDLNPNTRQGVSQETARKMAGAALAKNEPTLRSMYPTYDQESASTRNVLRSMAFNLGTTGLSKFRNMERAITSGDTEAARREALDSKRARQIPARAKREAEMMMPRPRKDERTGRMYSPLPPE